jgi:hypothetical protein
MSKNWGWRKINRNYYKFRELISAEIRRVYTGWQVVINDKYWNKYDYKSQPHKRWHQAYADLCDRMPQISKQIKDEVNKIIR